MKLFFLCLTLFVTLLALFVFSLHLYRHNTYVVSTTARSRLCTTQYAVVVDAGSTGSRVLAYRFNISSVDGIVDNRILLSDELYKESEPGLSSFADEPSKGAHSIKLLLDEARAFIPKEKWTSTPLVLKATAGLRLLPAHKAEHLLNAVRDLFAKSNFSVAMDAVEIMDGIDEGIFSWLTVNILLDRLSKSNQAAALDLGGGSTQVTFAPTDPDLLPLFEKYIKEVKTPNNSIYVFTNSYLGLGLMAARHSVFTNGYPIEETNIESICINPSIKNRTWMYSNTEYKLSGKGSTDTAQNHSIVDFDACLDLVRSKVIPLVKLQPLALNEQTIVAFNYYFELAINAELVHTSIPGEIKVEAYRNKAQEICGIANDEQPFMCFDLTFVSVLLQEGFGLSDTKKIKVFRKIDGHEISWALGCAYNLLTRNINYN